MNTRRFNEKVARRQAQNARSCYNLSRSQRRVRAPAHGLLGDTLDQKKHWGRTHILSHSQALKLKKKGDSAEVRVLAESLPDVIVEQSLHAAEEGHDIRMPMADYPEHAQPLDSNAWEDDDSSDESDTSDYGRMMGDGMRVHYREYRKRRDKTKKTQQSWREQLEPGITAFMEYCMGSYYGDGYSAEDSTREVGGDGSADSEGTMTLSIIDIFDTRDRVIPYSKGYRSTSIIRAGYIPVAPLIHTSAFTTRTIVLYHSLFVRCPRIGRQPFLKAICDIQGVPFKQYMSTQLAAAFDTYVALRNGARQRVLKKLGRDAKDYRMLNACPPCQLRLHEDEELPIRMVVGMDGNDSLRRVERRGDAEEARAAAGVVDDDVERAGSSLGPSKELPDPRVGGGSYFLSHAEVDAWDESNWDTVTELPLGDNLTPVQRLWKEGECENRWHNAKESNTARASGHFMECGWFVLLCRHMILLLACDMIRSGEQFKYPLATLNRFMSADKEERAANGEGPPTGSLAVSYDIGCKLSKTVARSPLKALAQFMAFLPVIGTMHGYAHQRLCQLLFLMLYIVGAGLEDGEFCERYFSVMNALAAITRHQSIFHRRQAIAEVAYCHDNFESYAQLSRFIYNNYRQSLTILATKDTLVREMRIQGITSADSFYNWLQQEGDYLRGLCKTPPKDTLEMEYFSKLESLLACQERLAVAREAWLMFTPDSQDKTSSVETKHRHEQENERKLLADIHAIESKLGLKRWKKGDEDWLRVKKMVRESKYQAALDRLEGLLVARIFEMARLNVAGTGYKMRKHLAKAFKNRSKSIQSAISDYNDAAASLSPPRPAVTWEELMEFSFLGEFDLLRNARDDVRDQPWASQKNRLLMQQFFKLIRAEEELHRLHQEIRRLYTYMAKEEKEVLGMAAAVESEDRVLAWHIREHWLERGRFNKIHHDRLASIKKLKGFDRRNRKYFVAGTPVWTSVDVTMQDAEQGAAEAVGLNDEAGVSVSAGDPGVVEGEDVAVDEDGSAIDEEEEGERAEAVEAILSIADG